MIINESAKVRLGYLGTMQGKGMYETARNNPEPIISLYEGNEPDDKRYLDMNREFFKVNKDVYSYYFFARENGIDIFMEMPLVKDDELFKWIRRDYGRVKGLWCQLQKGFFKFNCMYHLSTKDVQINVVWEKEHLDFVWVKNASNEEILEAINKWIAEFEVHVLHSVETEEMKNVG